MNVPGNVIIGFDRLWLWRAVLLRNYLSRKYRRLTKTPNVIFMMSVCIGSFFHVSRACSHRSSSGTDMLYAYLLRLLRMVVLILIRPFQHLAGRGGLNLMCVCIYTGQSRPADRIDLGGCGTPQKWTFLNLTPLTLLQKPHFLPTLWLKVDLLADWGGVRRTPAPPWLRAWVRVYICSEKKYCLDFLLSQQCPKADIKIVHLICWEWPWSSYLHLISSNLFLSLSLYIAIDQLDSMLMAF